MPGIRVFLSYSHADEAHKDELAKHLSAAQKQGMIETWHDRKIQPGENIHAAIDSNLKNSEVILLLVSPDFISSAYCYDNEMKQAILMHEQNNAVVIPAIIRPCDWHNTPFGTIAAVPTDGKPVTLWHDRDAAYLEIALAVREIAEKIDRRNAGLGEDLNPIDNNQQTNCVNWSYTEPKTTQHPQMDRDGTAAYQSSIKRKFTDKEIQDFVEKSFTYTLRHFEERLVKEEAFHDGVLQHSMRSVNADSFEATIFLHGQQRRRCGIWIDRDIFSSGHHILYSSEGLKGGFNEMLTVEQGGSELLFKPTIGSVATSAKLRDGLLTKEEAADHVWLMFVQNLDFITTSL